MEAYWYFDFASPFAYLQLAKVQEWRSRLPFTAVPVLARALPTGNNDRAVSTTVPEDSAEGFVRYRAKTLGIPLTSPATYPFNSVAALRLCAAAGSSWHAIETIFAHLWRDGLPGATPEELKPVAATLGVTSLGTTGGVFDTGARLRENTEGARTLGVMTVPTIRAGSRLFHGANAAAEFDDWLAQPTLRRSA
jgi:2-hydroxychromene-2-carboxylate isomerase